MNKKIIAITIVTIAGGLVYGFFFRAGNNEDFISAYGVYDAASDAHAAAAHIPGNGGNLPRQKLNEILSKVLTENLSSEEREKLSGEGLVLAKELRGQIDTIGKEGKKTEIALETLRSASKNAGGFFTRRKAGVVVALAKERSKTIQDIEEISYGINTRLENIFRGVIADRGTLTTERIIALNQDLPEAEKQFDRLTENYRTLDEIEKKIDAVFPKDRVF